MSEVVDVTEELVVQLREADHGDGAVLVEGPRVALQPGAEVSDVGGDLLDHQPPETESSNTSLRCLLKHTNKDVTETDTDLISLLQMASGVSNSPRNISEKRSAS